MLNKVEIFARSAQYNFMNPSKKNPEKHDGPHSFINFSQVDET
jgi:hypothetical protein